MMTNVRRLKRWVVLADAPIYPYPRNWASLYGKVRE